MRTRAALVLLALAACHRSSAPAPEATPSAAPAASIAKPAWDVPFSTSTAPIDWTDPVVVVTPAELRLEHVERKTLAKIGPEGIDPAAKPDPKGFAITPLIEALKKSGAKTVAFAIAPSVSYRTVTEVLFSAGQAEVVTDRLLTKSPATGTGYSVIAFTPPKIHPSAKTPGLQLLVLVVNDGFGMKGTGGNVAPGCKDLGPGLTVPKTKAGDYDTAGLKDCAKKIATQFPGETEVTITAPRQTPYARVIAAADAVRESFPDLRFGISP